LRSTGTSTRTGSISPLVFIETIEGSAFIGVSACLESSAFIEGSAFIEMSAFIESFAFIESSAFTEMESAVASVLVNLRRCPLPPPMSKTRLTQHMGHLNSALHFGRFLLVPSFQRISGVCGVVHACSILSAATQQPSSLRLMAASEPLGAPTACDVVDEFQSLPVFPLVGGQGIPEFAEQSGRPRRTSHLLLHEGSPRLPHASRTSLWSVNCGSRRLPYGTAGTITYRTVPYLTAASSRPALRVPHLIISSNIITLRLLLKMHNKLQNIFKESLKRIMTHLKETIKAYHILTYDYIKI
jgi:hypothetical protein